MGQGDALLVAIIGGTALLGFGPWVRLAFSERSRRKAYERMATELHKAGLRLDADARLAVRSWTIRRVRSQALGSGIGVTIGCTMAFVLRDVLDVGAATLLMLGAVVGMAAGAAASSFRVHALASAGPRVTALQPHDLRDYLRRRELALEAACAVAGTAILLVGLALAVIDRISRSAGAVALVLGGVVATVSVVGLLLQRRMLRAPMPADSRARVVANDIVLATGIRDLLGMIVLAAYFSLLSWVYWLDGPVWQLLTGIVVLPALMLGYGDRYLRPDVAPVAHRLAGRAAA